MSEIRAEYPEKTRGLRRVSGWQTKPLEEVCHVEYGTRVVQKRDGGKGFPVYGGGGATFEVNGFNREDQLVIARFGMSEECTRFVAGKFYLNDSGLTVSPKNGAMDQRFLDYQMLALNDHIYALGKGTAQKNLDVPLFRSLPLFIPDSLTEQQRIVGLLDEAFAALATAKANAEQNLHNARALFESHLNAVFTQRGEGWVEKSVGELVAEGLLFKPFDGNHGEIHPKKSDYTESGVPFIMARDLQNGFVDTDHCIFVSRKLADSLRVGFAKDGDVLISHKGTIGRSAIVSTEDDYIMLTPQVTGYRVKDLGKLFNRFIRYFFMCPDFQREMIAGAADGSTRAYIGITKQLSLRFRFPSLAEQKRIASKLDGLDPATQRLARLYERKLAALEELKKSLLHEAFSGAL
jgi:type I restriction enzyme S subunit